MVDIYVVGTSMNATGNNIATYWKNGIAVSLTDNSTPSSANAIAISGNDIYIAGTATIAGKVTAVYWKNGSIIKLTNGNSGWASANGIAVSGNDVYVAGNAVNGNDVIVVGYNGLGATYWKNGVATRLPDSAAFGGNRSSANGIVIDGNDVYISGNMSGIITSGPAYWKNGVMISLSDNTYYEKATCIAVGNSDVYVGGTTVDSKNIAYWKNGLATVVQQSPSVSNATSILAINSDIYVTGNSSDANGEYVATYWKNGTPTKYEDGTMSGYTGYISSASGLAVRGSDTYISGNVGTDAVYWKNGKITLLAKNSTANAIAVMLH